VFTQGRRAIPQVQLGVEKMDRTGNRWHGSGHGVRQIKAQTSVAYLLVGEHGLEIVDWPAGHTSGLKIRNPVIGRTATSPCLDQRHKRLPVRDAGRIIREQLVVGEFRTSSRFAEATKLAVVADSKNEVTIGCCKGLIGDDVG
jgi:hypothetical protein